MKMWTRIFEKKKKKKNSVLGYPAGHDEPQAFLPSIVPVDCDGLTPLLRALSSGKFHHFLL